MRKRRQVKDAAQRPARESNFKVRENVRIAVYATLRLTDAGPV